ncbi:MAG: mechanosensitive ion channel, partial [Rhodothermia bacterium]|nr:mechanosensitive ion channel [Rhodothermia bacterium]
LDEPAPQVVLLELGGSSINWEVRVWAPTSDFLAVKQHAIRIVKKKLDEAGVGIPFPQMDVHIDGALASPTGG